MTARHSPKAIGYLTIVPSQGMEYTGYPLPDIGRRKPPSHALYGVEGAGRRRERRSQVGNSPAAAGQGNGDHAERREEELRSEQRHRGRLADRR